MDEGIDQGQYGERESKWRSDVNIKRAKAIDQMKRARERSHRVANQRRVESHVKVGDHVYWRDPRKGPNVASKLSRTWKGPCVVKKVLPTGIVVIRVGNKMRRIACDHVKPLMDAS